MNEYIDTPDGTNGVVTFTPDPLYKTDGEEVRIDGRIVGRIRRMSSGTHRGEATISGLAVADGATRSDAIRLVLEQAREDLRNEAREKA